MMSYTSSQSIPQMSVRRTSHTANASVPWILAASLGYWFNACIVLSFSTLLNWSRLSPNEASMHGSIASQ